MSTLFEKMKQSILDYDSDAAVALAKQSLAEGVDPAESIEKGYAAGMEEIGRLFNDLEIFLPEVMLAADAMIEVIDVLKWAFASDKGGINAGKVVIGTIKGDVHDIGKNIVKTMLIANGFTVYDMGKDVSPNAFVERAIETEADIIAMSALCTSTMLHMPDVPRLLKDKGIRNAFKVIVGGAPVLPAWAEDFADGYSENASDAVQLCRKIKETTGFIKIGN